MVADAGKMSPPRKRRFNRGNLTGARGWMVLALVLVPIVSILLKQSSLPFGAWLREMVSLQGSPALVHSRVAHVLLVPLGAAIVVFFRVTLGIRVLGPFRSVLLAIAFQITGVLLGLFFLALVVGVIVAVKPMLKKIKLPYFARLAVSLSTVATIVMMALLLARALHWEVLSRTAYFPLVVLCLTADGFASTLRREGYRSALWRGTATAAVAVLITGVAAIPGIERLLASNPELLLLEIASIVLISEFLGFRLLSRLNPPVKKRAKRKRAKAKRSSPAKSMNALRPVPTPEPQSEPPSLLPDPLSRRTAQ